MNTLSFSMSKMDRVDIEIEFIGPYSVSVLFENGCGESKRINATKDNNGWHPASEMPEEGQAVLCIDEWGTYHIAWHGIGWYDTETETAILDNIKWWMPLPHGPKEDG